MRTYEITNQDGIVLRRHTVDDSIRPALLDGEEALLTHIDGEPAIQGEELDLTDEERARFGELGPVDANLPPEYVNGVTVEGRPDDAHPGTQIEPIDGAAPIAKAIPHFD